MMSGAVDHVRDVRQRLDAQSEPQRVGEPADQAVDLPGQQQDERGAEVAADDAAEAADDHHRQQLDRDVDRELLGRDRVIEA